MRRAGSGERLKPWAALAVLLALAGFAVAGIEGRQVLLAQVRSASGAFYAEGGEEGAGYFWKTKGAAAMLFWRDGAGGETLLLEACETEK